MNVIYGQVGILTKLILPHTNGPLSSPLEANSTSESASQGSGTKSRHTSVTLLTPLLDRVTEEDMDIPVFKANGKVDKLYLPSEGAALQLTQQLEHSTKKEPVIQQPDEPPITQQGSGCIIS
jgi:hypothetical protein